MVMDVLQFVQLRTGGNVLGELQHPKAFVQKFAETAFSLSWLAMTAIKLTEMAVPRHAPWKRGGGALGERPLQHRVAPKYAETDSCSSMPATTATLLTGTVAPPLAPSSTVFSVLELYIQ